MDMSCEEFKRSLDDWIDNELDEAKAAEFRSHADCCDPCEKLADDTEAMMRCLKTKLKKFGAPANLQEMVARALDEA